VFQGKKVEATKYPEDMRQVVNELRDEGKFKIKSNKDGSTIDQCVFLLHILHRPVIGFVLLLKMETLFGHSK